MIKKDNITTSMAAFKLIFFSIIGLVMFFFPVTIAGKTTILFDHAASYLVKQQRSIAIAFVFLLMCYGVVKPFVTGRWKDTATNKILSIFKVLGLVLAIMFLFNIGPASIMAKDMLPFLFNKLALPVGIIVPSGALALACLVGFGLLEMIGVLFEPIMRPIWKTPGSSAIDAIASFVGSYSIGLLITNRVYQQKLYSTRQAVIIATGFSTVSAAFMIIVAKTLSLMPYWNFFFWSTLIITFLVTAITVRIPPISLIDDTDGGQCDDSKQGSRLVLAWNKGLETAGKSGSIPKIIWSNFRDGLEMSAAIVPSIIAIGLLGLLIAKYTPFFNLIGYCLAPFSWVAGLEEPLKASSAMASSLAEMFLPALLSKDFDILTRYVIGVVSISSILFFSAMIPCVLATSIPISVGKMVIIWFERVALSILLAGWLGKLALLQGWLLS